jgi:hypothetical protein
MAVFCHSRNRLICGIEKPQGPVAATSSLTTVPVVCVGVGGLSRSGQSISQEALITGTADRTPTQVTKRYLGRGRARRLLRRVWWRQTWQLRPGPFPTTAKSQQSAITLFLTTTSSLTLYCTVMHETSPSCMTIPAYCFSIVAGTPSHATSAVPL